MDRTGQNVTGSLRLEPHQKAPSLFGVTLYNLTGLIILSLAVLAIIYASTTYCGPGDPSIRIGNMLVGGCR